MVYLLQLMLPCDSRSSLVSSPLACFFFLHRLLCISGQILPGDKLLLVNGAAVTGLEDASLMKLVCEVAEATAESSSTIALTIVPKTKH